MLAGKKALKESEESWWALLGSTTASDINYMNWAFELSPAWLWQNISKSDSSSSKSRLIRQFQGAWLVLRKPVTHHPPSHLLFLPTPCGSSANLCGSGFQEHSFTPRGARGPARKRGGQVASGPGLLKEQRLRICDLLKAAPGKQVQGEILRTVSMKK